MNCASQSSRPIIILGAARSGTKFLRDTLGASHETALVPYDVNYIWRSGNEAVQHDALDASLATEPIIKRVKSGLARVAGLCADDQRRLVEKTVSNTLRLDFVARVFPDADYVHLVRDGRAVLESSLRQWRAPADWHYLMRKVRAFPLRNYRYAFWYMRNRTRAWGRGGVRVPVWGARYPGIECDVQQFGIAMACARQWVRSVTSVQEALQRLPTVRVHELRYESLISDRRVLEGLVRWLGLQHSDAVLERYVQTVSSRPSVAWEAGLSAREVTAVQFEITPLLRRLGYG